MFGYPPVQLYHVRVNNGTVLSTTGTETNIAIPGSTFLNAGIYSFSVRAVNVLGESAPLVADLNGITKFMFCLCNVVYFLCCWLQLL